MTDRSGESPALRPPLRAAREPLPGQAAPPSQPLSTSDHITTDHVRHDPATTFNLTPPPTARPLPRTHHQADCHGLPPHNLKAGPPLSRHRPEDHITTRRGRHNPAAATDHLPATAITPASGLHLSPRSTP
ncbi:hypothetical protein [Lentzea sp. NPDC092896]|uniref:hypothetical protein n=1 Tax=Lentzea sp. NPDC092896 TaxID=3364127 RepID=UPI0037FACAAE